MISEDLIPVAFAFLRQITELRTHGGSYVIDAWAADPRHRDNQVHRHSSFEICYVTNGSGVYLDRDSSHPLKPGTLFCSRPYVWHRIHQGEELGLVWVSFRGDGRNSSEAHWKLIEKLRTTDRYLLPDAGQLPAVLTWHALLQQAASHTGLEEVVRPLAGAFLNSLVLAFVDAEPAGDHSPLVSTADHGRLLKQAHQFMTDNLSRPLQLQTVANYLHISQRHLSRLFHDYSKYTFVQQLTNIRLSKAAELLREGNSSLKEIAEVCGFGNIHYFTKVFTSTIGTSPGKYRESPFRIYEHFPSEEEGFTEFAKFAEYTEA
ncbi:AraC family transcriptional regulator [Paenibacillus gansuensis]|uniref:Helix-turn-helix domain-containing protein n=1 Tax=Paenibacillus gansuensis TaxID=306542 RepID=A0ABW5PA74_9BACL